MNRFLTATLVFLFLLPGCSADRQVASDPSATSPPPVFGVTEAQPAAAPTVAITPAASMPQSPSPETATTQTATPQSVLRQQPGVVTADYPARINVDQLKSLMDSGAAFVIDVRSLDQYQQEHVVGAQHILFSQITARAGEIPKGKTIVTYCA